MPWTNTETAQRILCLPLVREYVGDVERVREMKIFCAEGDSGWSTLQDALQDDKVRHHVRGLLGAGLKDLNKLFKRRFKSLLPGGVLAQPSERATNILRKTEATNDNGEQSFAQHDYYTALSPCTTLQQKSSLIKEANNNTLDWLESQRPEDMVELLNNIRAFRRKNEKNVQEHDAEVERLKREYLLQKMRKKETKIANAKARKAALDVGAIHCFEAATAELAKFSQKKDKLKYLKEQIRLRGHHSEKVGALLTPGWVGRHPNLPQMLAFLQECVDSDPHLVVTAHSRNGNGPEADAPIEEVSKLLQAIHQQAALLPEAKSKDFIHQTLASFVTSHFNTS